MSGETNKRDFSRALINIEAELVSGETTIRGHAGNVSMRGMLVYCSDRLAAGTECAVKLHLGDPGVHSICINANGKVVRNIEDGMGVEFTEIDLESFEYLRNLVRMNADNISQIESEFKDHLGLKGR